MILIRDDKVVRRLTALEYYELHDIVLLHAYHYRLPRPGDRVIDLRQLKPRTTKAREDARRRHRISNRSALIQINGTNTVVLIIEKCAEPEDQLVTDQSTQDLLAKARAPAEEALRLHPYYRGKVQMMPKCSVRGLEDFSTWYTPGVAAPCRAIEQQPDLVYEHTNKGNTIAIVSDGSRWTNGTCIPGSPRQSAPKRKHRVSRAWSEAKPCCTKRPGWPCATRATRRRS
jgi:hypothetical protein